MKNMKGIILAVCAWNGFYPIRRLAESGIQSSKESILEEI
jgi:hypothetical protein